jgi:hypothetical protein
MENKKLECYLELMVQPNTNSYKFRCLSEENIDDFSLNGENDTASPRVKVIFNLDVNLPLN